LVCLRVLDADGAGFIGLFFVFIGLIESFIGLFEKKYRSVSQIYRSLFKIYRSNRENPRTELIHLFIIER
jgi:hypothetical protein